MAEKKALEVEKELNEEEEFDKMNSGPFAKYK